MATLEERVRVLELRVTALADAVRVLARQYAEEGREQRRDGHPAQQTAALKRQHDGFAVAPTSSDPWPPNQPAHSHHYVLTSLGEQVPDDDQDGAGNQGLEFAAAFDDPPAAFEPFMAAVMIRAGPHKGSHTAVLIGAAEELLGELRVHASVVQAERLPAWAAAWPDWTWAVEARGPGSLAGPAAPVRGRADARCAAQAGRLGAAAGRRGDEQERPQRRPLRRCRGVALRSPP
jgi:hypothetical protein